MKYLFLPLFICPFLFSCTSVPVEYLEQDNICNYKESIFHVSKDELKIDLNILKQRKNSDITITDSKVYKNRYSTLSSGNIINYQTDKRTNIGKWLTYRSNGTIKTSEIYHLEKTVKIFKETHYDKEGNVTKVIDYEKGYNICWAEAIEIVKKIAKRDIEKYGITEFYVNHTNLNKQPDVKPIWFVSLKGDEDFKNKTVKHYQIDGVTGKLLKTIKVKKGYGYLY